MFSYKLFSALTVYWSLLTIYGIQRDLDNSVNVFFMIFTFFITVLTYRAAKHD